MIKEGTIFRVRTKFSPFKIRTYLSVCIRFFNKTTRNHAAIAIKIEGELYAFEAWERVICTPLDVWLKRKGFDISTIEPWPGYDADFARKKALSMVGWVEYNYWGTMFFQLVNQLFNVWVGPTGDKANERVQCAQFVAILYKKPLAWLWTPSDLDNGKL